MLRTRVLPRWVGVLSLHRHRPATLRTGQGDVLATVVPHLAAAVGGLLGPGLAGIAADVTAGPAAGAAVAVVLGAAGCAVFLRVRPTPTAA